MFLKKEMKLIFATTWVYSSLVEHFLSMPNVPEFDPQHCTESWGEVREKKSAKQVSRTPKAKYTILSI